MILRNSVFGVSALFTTLLLVNSVPAAAQYYGGSNRDPDFFYFHSGATNPLDEGWDIDKTGGTSRADASDQQYPDVSAWEITATGKRLNYFRAETPEPGDSWTLITRFRVVNKNTPLSYNTVAGIDYGHDPSTGSVSQRYIFAAGSSANGETELRFQSTDLSPLGAGGDGEHHVVAAGPDGNTDYVTVALVHDGTDMDVYINGDGIFSNLADIAGTLHNRIQFGDGRTTGGTDVSRWTEVLFSIGPQACRDGIDNDGDGILDIDDPDCSDPNDPTEGDSNRTMVSWGSNGTVNRVRGTTGGTAMLAVSNGGGHSVALKANGQLVAWGENDKGQAAPAPGTDFVAVAAGGEHSLALRADGTVAGWGDNENGRATPPDEPFKAISAGTNHSLGLRDDGTVVQWGVAAQEVSGVFQSIDAGHDYSLGVRMDGSIACWGDDAMCSGNPPPAGNDYIAVAAGHTHALALKANGSIVGWGSNGEGEIDLPVDENYIAVAAGDRYSLALTNDGTLVHRGRNQLALTPSGDDFVAISAGANHATAIRGIPAFETPAAVCSDAIPTPGVPRTYHAFDGDSLNAAIACYNGVSGGDISIQLGSDDLSLVRTLDFAVNNSSAARLFIAGNNANVGIEGGRFLTIESGDVEVSNITIYDGIADHGGAFYNAGTLTIRDSTLHSNTASTGGGAILNASGGNLTVLSSTLRGNTTNEGGAIENSGVLSIVNSTLSDNSSMQSGGALLNSSSANLMVLNSTLRNNSASEGGAIENSGVLSIVNSTLSGNSSTLSGGALLNASDTTTTIYNSTLAGNPSATGAAINNSGELTLKNTIVDNAGVDGASCVNFTSAQLIADVHNLDSDGSCGNATTSTSIGLGPLQDNGGSTHTHGVPATSPAVNAGDDTVCDAEPVNGIDQRGESRSAGLSSCDIGAYEVPGPAIESQQFASVTENQLGAIDLDVETENGTTGDVGVTYHFSFANGGGLDNTLFNLDSQTGIVSFIQQPDFERPADNDTNNRYRVQVNVVDENGIDRLVDIEIVVRDDAADNCAPDQHRRSITSLNTWHLLALPCSLPVNSKFTDLFNGQLLLDDEWSAFVYDASLPGYQRITATSPAPGPGTGFWFITTEPFELVIPAGSQKAPPSPTEACDGGPCYRQTIEGGTGWNLIGNPAVENLRYSEMRISNESTMCIDSTPCSLSDPVDAKITSAMFIYNSFAGVYRSVDESVQQVVKPWDGYWAMFDFDGDLNAPWQLYSKEYTSQFLFVTDESFAGDFGGLGGARDICQQAADDAGLPGNFVAWLSDFEHSPLSFSFDDMAPYVRVDGAVVAQNTLDLRSGAIHKPINVSPRLSIFNQAMVWTATQANGVRIKELTCGGFWLNGSVEFSAVYGNTSNTDAGWTNFDQATCDTEARLYCFAYRNVR